MRLRLQKPQHVPPIMSWSRGRRASFLRPPPQPCQASCTAHSAAALNPDSKDRQSSRDACGRVKRRAPLKTAHPDLQQTPCTPPLLPLRSTQGGQAQTRRLRGCIEGMVITPRSCRNLGYHADSLADLRAVRASSKSECARCFRWHLRHRLL